VVNVLDLCTGGLDFESWADQIFIAITVEPRFNGYSIVEFQIYLFLHWNWKE